MRTMQKNTIWSILVSIILSLITSPFIGTYISNIYIGYAKSDSEISIVFEVSSLISFFIISGMLFYFLRKFIFNNKKAGV